MTVCMFDKNTYTHDGDEFPNELNNIISRFIYFSRLTENGSIEFDYEFNKHLLNFNVHYRSYVQERINGSEIINGGVKNAYFHFAVIHDYGFYTWNDYLASCLTYVPQNRVPPGGQHSVTDQICMIC